MIHVAASMLLWSAPCNLLSPVCINVDSWLAYAMLCIRHTCNPVGGKGKIHQVEFWDHQQAANLMIIARLLSSLQ
jgi:hypothetical protein